MLPWDAKQARHRLIVPGDKRISRRVQFADMATGR